MGYSSRFSGPVHEVTRVARKVKQASPGPGLWLALAGVGAVVLLGMFIGPDLVRYIKIKRM